MAQQALRREDDERLLDGLAALARSRWKYEAGVVGLATCMLSSARELQEALDARARVLRPLPLVAVRQQQHEAARLAPLRLGAGEELVDDHLRAVHEVAELRLPQHERAVLGHRVAVLEAQHRGLGEERVVDLEAHAGRAPPR